MAENTIERIKQYLDSKKIRVSAFEREVGMSNGSFASQLKHHKTIGVDKLENILKRYSDINPEWLLTGVGSMIKPTIFEEEGEIYGFSDPENAVSYKDLADSRKETIDGLKKIIMHLEEQVETYRKSK
ncbi:MULTISPECIES: hypothetical protein [Flavobacterium]|uniref:XRE family transcriptional regulator n=1 Tax=Flavobacterium endoglycinae TaxID=2816357 RepID=A0ABX7QIH2_9FLAO|nr:MULTISPECIES: hypothetical protein [Flavobacterium]QSW90448.1 hypothetical protein J0383_06460 [Flavobacterium endoglycinae]